MLFLNETRNGENEWICEGKCLERETKRDGLCFCSKLLDEQNLLDFHIFLHACVLYKWSTCFRFLLNTLRKRILCTTDYYHLFCRCTPDTSQLWGCFGEERNIERQEHCDLMRDVKARYRAIGTVVVQKVKALGYWWGLEPQHHQWETFCLNSLLLVYINRLQSTLKPTNTLWLYIHIPTHRLSS